ncbi:hypothetical protein [Paenibacillus sp. IHBB 10380]|uniref:hypothetical protein n=1 Tax=Paenibacillus sp. IHBB 10380 TaxID=1566358 RepID=UPI0005CFBF38|nr:hypothetical protein [Paenibacillus sp. IHBB 10380]AJS57724.1 hypothetical protein UB51_03575 [Paenibacillus sp. IHBB 10380]
MTSKNDVKLGLFIVIAGLVILLGKLGVFGFLGRTLWPVVILVLGLLLHALFYGRSLQPILLIPAGILTVWGLLFTICNLWGWHLMANLWPALVLGIAVGLYEYYFYESPRATGILTVSVLLGILTLILFFFSLLHTGVIYILAVALIACGAWLIWGRERKSKSKWNRSW